jgi:hypothetical protein
VSGKGGNKGRPDSQKSEDTRRQNGKDEAVSRDPDIAGVMRRESRDVHARGRQERG